MSGGSDEPDWRRAETYAYTAALTRTGWAWEFLRRNPEFRGEFSPAAGANPCEESEEVFQRRFKRWGLCFC